MLRKLILLFTLFCFFGTFAQTNFAEVTYVNHLKGTVLDSKSKEPLPYANIYVLNTTNGVISNETGNFSLNIAGIKESDTVCFQYIGYRTKNISFKQLQDSFTILLEEELFNLSETLVFGSIPNLKDIVKKVIENKDVNYKKTNSKLKVFIRKRENSDIKNFDLDLRKTSFDELDENLIRTIEKAMPKNSISYTDFMGNFYCSAVQDDSIKYKTDPIRTVSLKEKDIAELEQLEKVFENVFKNTDEEEYWKIKSGIFGQKIDMDEENNDTVSKKDTTINNSRRRLSYFNNSIVNNLKFSNLDDEKQWEFLYKLSRYKYTLAGGIAVNGEDVYIIDFEPNNRGMYIGRMYISMETYALIKADYKYAPGKNGRDLSLLGVSYSEDQFKGSVYFQKKDGTYKLKYYSKTEGASVGFDRSIALLKKRKRWLLDKPLNEIKVGINLEIESSSLVEFLVLDENEISHNQYANFKQQEYMDVIYVDQFDEDLWKEYSIIEPTRKMREYKKLASDDFISGKANTE